MLSMSRALILCVAMLVALLAVAVPLMSVVAQEPSSSVAVDPSSSVAVDPSSSVAVDPSSSVAVEPSSSVAVEPSSSVAVEPSSSVAIEPSSSVAVEPSSSVAVEPSSSVREEPSSSAATASSSVTAEPSSSVVLSSSGLELSSSAPAASSSVPAPQPPNITLSAFAAFFVNETFDNPPAFVLNLTDVTADSSCHTDVPDAPTVFKSYFLAACSGETSQLTLNVFLFGAADACNTTANNYYNVSAVNADPTTYSPDLFLTPYTYVDADGTSKTGKWYAYVKCPAVPQPSSSSDDSKIGVVIGGVVIGVIVVFIVIALLYSRRNRKTVDQTGAPIATTDANQAYSRL